MGTSGWFTTAGEFSPPARLFVHRLEALLVELRPRRWDRRRSRVLADNPGRGAGVTALLAHEEEPDADIGIDYRGPDTALVTSLLGVEEYHAEAGGEPVHGAVLSDVAELLRAEIILEEIRWRSRRIRRVAHAQLGEIEVTAVRGLPMVPSWLPQSALRQETRTISFGCSPPAPR